MKYILLFNIEVQHDFFSDQRCAEFAFFPTEGTIKHIKNHRLIYKPKPSGITIYMPVMTDDKPKISLQKEISFSFWLSLLNTSFFHYTDLPGVGPFHFTYPRETGDERTFDLGLLKENYTEAFIIKGSNRKTVFSLGVKPVWGFTKDLFKLKGLGSRKVLGYNPDEGTITVNTQDKVGETFSVSYEVARKTNPDVFGLLEMTPDFDEKNNVIPGINYTVSFQAKKTVWKYYVVTKSGNGNTTYQIVDESPSNENPKISFGKVVNLVSQPDLSDPIAVKLADRYPNTARYRFESDQEIPYRQFARKYIRLRKQGNNVIEHLPNPAIDSNATQIITYL